MNKKLVATSVLALVVIGLAVFFSKSDTAVSWLWAVSDGGKLLLPLIVVSALVDSINPCAFSVLIVSLIFLFGLGRSKENILSLGLLYIAGIFAAYFLIGLGLLQILHIFSIPHFMSKIAAMLLALFGLINILESVFPNFPIKFKIPHSAHGAMNRLLEKVSFPAMFGLGALVGLCEFPCTGGPYLAAVGLLHDTQTYWKGAGYLLLYNFLFVSPLLLILLLAGNSSVAGRIMEMQKNSGRKLKLIAGFLMLILSVVILNL
jgi:cytochrome c-type biogenesis protein